MKLNLKFFEIPAADFKRAIEFYELIFQVKFKTFESKTEKMAFFPDECNIMGSISYSKDFSPSNQGVLITFEATKDLNTVLDKIKTSGGKIVKPKTKIEAENMGYFALFLDSEGNRIGLYSEE